MQPEPVRSRNGVEDHTDMCEIALDEKPSGCTASECPKLQASTSSKGLPCCSLLPYSILVIILIGSLVVCAIPRPLHNSFPQSDVNNGSLVARDAQETNIMGRYAYQSLRNSKNGKPPKPDQVIPLVELVEDGKTITARVSHTHPNPVPSRLPRSAEPSVYNSEDVDTANESREVDSDVVHTEYETRTVAIATDEEEVTIYGPSVFEILHTHTAGRPEPIAPDINTNMANGDEVRSEAGAGTTTAASLLRKNDASNREPQISISMATITSAARLPEVSGSLIADAFFDITHTVTHVSGSTWRQVTTSTPRASSISIPASSIVGPIVTLFEPIINTTFEVIPMRGDCPDDPYSIYINPIATGAPTRADHISIMSSWRANGGKYPAVPTRYDIVWDHRTNTTWNKTIEGTWDNWVEVYVSITTQYPAPPKTPVADVPTSPGQSPYDPETNPDFTIAPGPNWVDSSPRVSTSTSDPPYTEPTTLPSINAETLIFPTPTEKAALLPKSDEFMKRMIDQNYPAPFFPGGGDKYQVWSEWIGYCGVVKHINLKGEPALPLQPFGDLNILGGDYIRDMCQKGLNYYIHFDSESTAGRYWLSSLVRNRNITKEGYSSTLPVWSSKSSNAASDNDSDILIPEWITDCLVILRHSTSSSWGNAFLLKANKNFDENGRLYISADRSLVRPPINCQKIEMLLHIREYHSMEGFQLADWWITPTDEEPFYISPSA
ncbi:hypothetical protein TWF730_005061 [Orbilia blumenaviensis]|uniref:Uncharacterized protein n=1 Tax=Orbilia blumenaviensis TaxID=1796055 RepID=A0AAV9VJF4_9PEZI